MKRTLPLKYSTNLTTEAKGQRVGLLPSEGEHIPLVAVAPSLPGFGCSLSTRSGEGGEGMTVLHCRHLPGPPEPQQRRSSLSVARVRGIRKKSGMESKETYFFFRSWEQRGQNHFPRGLVVSPTQAKWNHSMEQSGLSQPIISP